MNTDPDAPPRAGGLGESINSSSPAASEKVSKSNGGVGQAREMATDAAAAVGAQVKAMLDRQVGMGSDLMSKFAKSAIRAGDELKREAPQLASLVQSAARRLDGFASDVHDQSVDQLVTSAGNYTRRQPALVFGVAAVAGFLALRTMKNASWSSKAPAYSGGTHRTTSHGA